MRLDVVSAQSGYVLGLFTSPRGPYGASDRQHRADGGKVGYPAKPASRMERAVARAVKAIATETKPLMSAPDEQVAAALRIATRR